MADGGQVVDVPNASGGGSSEPFEEQFLGTVIGPEVSVDDRIVVFEGTDGEEITDSGVTVAEVIATAVSESVAIAGDVTQAQLQEAIASVAGGGSEAAQNSFLVRGGQVTWQSDYTFLVSAAEYYINGVLYASPQTQVVLTAAHATLDRIDTVAVNDSGTVIKVDGTAAATPSEPDIDPGTQLKLGIVLVTADTTEPVAISNTTVFTEQAGHPGEWNASASAGSIVVNSSSNPRTGTVCVEGTNVVAGVYAQFQIGAGDFNPNLHDFLILYIKSKGAWANKRGLQITLRNAGVQVGNLITIDRNGSFGFDDALTSTYQQVAIPVSQFAVANGLKITQVRIADFGGAIGFFIDDISWQSGAISQTPTGLTQAQADARYAPIATAVVGQSSSVDSEIALFSGTGGKTIKRGTGTGFPKLTSGVVSVVPLRSTITMVIEGGGAVITTGEKGVVEVPFDCTITAWRIFSDVPGSIVVDVWKDTYANFPPTVADTIAASAKPTLSDAQKNQDTTLTGWTTTITAGDILKFKVDSVSTVTRVTVQLTVTRVNH